MGSKISNENSGSQERTAPKGAWPAWVKFIVSLVLILHFSLIALVYFSNNSLSRMSLADRVLEKFHPYLIGFGWYTELLPMSIIGSEAYDKPVTIDYRLERTSKTWNSWIDSTTSDLRWKRLAQLAGALAVNDDDEGMGQIALSLVRRARAEGLEFEQIRFTAKEADSEKNVLLYQATIIPLSSGELTLVPELDSTRTVPVSQVTKP
ncbi:MAG: hypothetical protein ACOVOJ_04680 [Pirellula sp.]|jgi:hypothetical protein